MSFCLAPAAVKFAAAVVNNECSAHAVIPGPSEAAEPGDPMSHTLCNSATLGVTLRGHACAPSPE